MSQFVEILDTTSDIDAKKLLDVMKKHFLSNKKSLLFLTASWCGPCKAFKPAIAEFKAKMNKNSGFVAHVDVKYHNELKNFIPSLEIEGYPTIAKTHDNNEVDYYKGIRNYEGVSEWAHKRKRKIYKSKKIHSKTQKRKSRKRRKHRKYPFSKGNLFYLNKKSRGKRITAKLIRKYPKSFTSKLRKKYIR